MQHALCITDDRVWEAEEFSKLKKYELDIKRNTLLCVECHEFAWFRKESKHGHPAHFCARHNPECGLKVNVVVDGSRDPASEEEEVSAGNTIVVNLEEEQGGELAVKPVMSPPQNGSGVGGRTFTIKGGFKESSQHFTLRRILHRLVTSPSFRESKNDLVLYKSPEEILISGPVQGIACGFENISRSHNDKRMLFWGPISSAKYGRDGILWLNSGVQYQSASVAIHPDIEKEFLKMFQIDDLEDLAGAYILAASRCSFPENGKPTVWGVHPKYLFVRKYNVETPDF